MPSIAPHASSPAIATGATSSAVTATFSPPANSLLAACVFANEGSSGTTVTMSNSGTALTWTSRARRDETDASPQSGLAAIFTAPCAAGATNITVTVTTNRAIGIGVKVYVLTGADLASPVGATGEGSSTTNAITPTGYTSTVANSHGIACAEEFSSAGVPTSTDDESAVHDVATDLIGMGVIKAADTATPSTAVTFNFDAFGTAAAEWNWCAVEIKPGASDASATPSTVTATTTVPTPSVSAGSSAIPATVTATTAVPAPSMSAGASATPATVTATVTVPTPAVTTDTATTVTPTTVAAVTAVPAPAVSASTSVQPATVTAAAAVYPLTVTAEFNASITLPHIAVTTQVDGVVASVPALPGDNMSGAAGQIEWNGFLLGDTTPYQWRTLAGWREKPPADSGNVPRSSRHGSYAGRPLLQERVITWTALLDVREEEVEAALVALELATPTEATEAERPLVINDLGTSYLIYGRIDRAGPEVDRVLRLGIKEFPMQWICSDPRRYNLLATGVTVPIGEDRTIGNGGNAETHPVLVVTGPAVGPIILNETTSKQVAFDVTLTSGQELTIDCDLGNATVAGVSVMGQLTGSSVHPTDFVLDRGNNVISHTATSGGVQVDVLYRDAWA